MKRWLCRLASLRLTLGALAALAAVLVWSRMADAPIGVWLVPPLALLVVNLSAAVATNPKLFRQRGLLVFHLGLASLALIGAVGRLVSFSGHVEVTEGAMVDISHMEGTPPALQGFPDELGPVVQGPFSVNYEAGMRRRETRSHVSISDGKGGWRDVVAGDDKPIVVGGYRFYTTANKGYAAILTWTDSLGRSESGGVHFPSYPMNFDRQGRDWRLPDGSRAVTLWLELPGEMFDENGRWSFAVPETARLVVVDGEARTVLEPGQSVQIGDNGLRYERLASWMGYSVFYDPTMPWLTGAAMIALLGLGWHVVARLWGQRGNTNWREVDHVA